MNATYNPAPPAPRWTWRVVLASGLCTLGLFMAVPLLETLRNLNPATERQVHRLPLVSELPPPPQPVTLPDAPPAPEAAAPVPLPELPLPAPPPPLPSLTAVAMPAVFTPTAWTTDPLRMAPMAPPAPAIFEIGGVDQPPVPRSQLRPLYPPRARLHRIEGWVDLEFVVTAEGDVEQVRVIAAQPDDIFERSAVQAAARWRFTPGRHQNKPVPVRVRQRISFELQ